MEMFYDNLLRTIAELSLNPNNRNGRSQMEWYHQVHGMDKNGENATLQNDDYKSEPLNSSHGDLSKKAVADWDPPPEALGTKNRRDKRKRKGNMKEEKR